MPQDSPTTTAHNQYQHNTGNTAEVFEFWFPIHKRIVYCGTPPKGHQRQDQARGGAADRATRPKFGRLWANLVAVELFLWRKGHLWSVSQRRGVVLSVGGDIRNIPKRPPCGKAAFALLCFAFFFSKRTTTIISAVYYCTTTVCTTGAPAYPRSAPPALLDGRLSSGAHHPLTARHFLSRDAMSGKGKGEWRLGKKSALPSYYCTVLYTSYMDPVKRHKLLPVFSQSRDVHHMVGKLRLHCIAMDHGPDTDCARCRER